VAGGGGPVRGRQAAEWCRDETPAAAAAGTRGSRPGARASPAAPWCGRPVVPQIQTAKKKTGVIAPKRFVQRLKRDNEAFRSYMHQACGGPAGRGRGGGALQQQWARRRVRPCSGRGGLCSNNGRGGAASGCRMERGAARQRCMAVLAPALPLTSPLSPSPLLLVSPPQGRPRVPELPAEHQQRAAGGAGQGAGGSQAQQHMGHRHLPGAARGGKGCVMAQLLGGRRPAQGPSGGACPARRSPVQAAPPSEPGPSPRLAPRCLPQGRLVNETRCLQCETVTSREEVFMDLGLEIENNTSLTACLKQFRWGGCGRGAAGLQRGRGAGRDRCGGQQAWRAEQRGRDT
jgi:hypothetical protein